LKCHEKSWENSSTSDKPIIRSFEEFWPYYVRQHSHPRTRILHATGSTLAVVLFGAAFATNLWLLVLVPVIGYSFAWYAHFFVERNKPATFRHPFYSLAADYRMLFLMMAGRMDEEVAKASRAVAGPVSPAGSPAV
jgi:hypothetical protein